MSELDINNNTSSSDEAEDVVYIEVPESLRHVLVLRDSDDFNVNKYFISQAQQNIVKDVIQARQVSLEMKKMGLYYANTTLLYGSPGCGKTTLVRYIAYKLYLPYVYINYSKLFSGVHGDPTSLLSDAFAWIKTVDCVFFMDEIDCIAQNREFADNDESKRITVCFMQEMDALRDTMASTVIFAATNRINMLDMALKSRFSMISEVKPMTMSEKYQYITNFLTKVNIAYDVNNVQNYVDSSVIASVRDIEADLTRCIAAWIIRGKDQFLLNHQKTKSF